MLKKTSRLLCFLFGTALFVPINAHAEGEFVTPGFSFKDETLNNNEDIESDPFIYRKPPIKYKGLMIQGDLSVEQSYNDNVRAEKNNTESDFITTISPHLMMQKNVARHSFFVDTKADLKRAMDVSDENTEDYSATLGADFEAYHNLRIPIRAGVIQNHRDRRSITSGFKTKTPIEIGTKYVNGGIVYNPNRLRIAANVQYAELRNENNTFLDTNAQAIFEDGDIDITTYDLNLSYSTRTSFRPFLNLRFENSDYLRLTFDGTSFAGNNRDNDYLQALVGTIFNYKGILYGGAAIGIDSRNYDDDTVDDTSNLSFVMNTNWVPYRKGKFNLVLEQSNVEDNQVTSGYDNTSVNLSYAHELQQDLYAQLSMGYQLQDFSSINREDDSYLAGLKLKYFVNPRIQLGAEYLYNKRESSTSINGYEQNEIMLRLTGSL